MISIHVKDRRSGTEVLNGNLIDFSNVPSSDDVRLLGLRLDTGYHVNFYARRQEIQALLESFPEAT